MFCTQCGNKMGDGDGFCGMCGTPRAEETQYQVPENPPQLVDAEDRTQALDSLPTRRVTSSAASEAPAISQIPSVTAEPPATSQTAPVPPSIPQGEPTASRPAKSNRKVVYIVVAAVVAVAVAGAVGTNVLGGSDDSATPGATDAVSNSASAASESDSASTSATSSPAVEDEPTAKNEPSADRIQANGFSFELPEYWKGKVVYEETPSGIAIYPDTTLGVVEGYELAKLSLVSADEPENGGDYVTHIAGRVRGDGVRVDVLSKNWAAFYSGDWYRHPNYAGSSQEQELVAALIDLSSGGAYSYSDVRSVAQNAASDADAIGPFQSVDVDFLNETLIPSVRIDGEGDNAGSATQSDEDYESMAKTMALQMFTTAEEAGDGALKWIGCDRALELVKPGSDAAACDYWEDTRFHVYLRIAKDATVTKTADPRHYQVQVTYESTIDATGTNRRANIANIELWLDESGQVEDIEILSLS